jgi:hypothetical protein
MASPKKLPSAEVLVEHAEAGMTNQEIAEKYGVTPEAVRQQLVKAGYHRPKVRPSNAYYIPWRLRGDHVGDTIARRLRSYSKRQQGKPLSASEERLLNDWLEYMEGANPTGLPLSVHYDRSDPAGFWLEPRRTGDRDFIHPPLSEAG